MNAVAATPQSPPRGDVTIWDLLWPLVAAAMFFGSMVLGGRVLIAAAFHNHAAGKAFVGGLSGSFWYLQSTVFAAYAFLFVVLWLLMRRKSDGALVGRFTPVAPATMLGAAGSGVAFAILFLVTVGVLMTSHLVEFHTTPAEQALAPHELPQLAMALATLSILAPLVEELYFRGFLLSWLDRKLGRIAAVAVSAALFGLFHFRFRSHAGAEGWVLTVTLTLLGVMNALWVFRARSLWPAVAVHAAYNATLVLPAVFVKH